MSVLEVSSTPNVYKLEKFIVIKTHDSFNIGGEDGKLRVTKPTYLSCYKVWVSVDSEGIKREQVDTQTYYDVAVPLNLWQVGTLSHDHDSNSLICPPYIETKLSLPKSNKTLAENITDGDIHRGSIIYAQRRDYGIDIYGADHDGSNYSRNGFASDEAIVQYIDVNADGRMLKISSQADKSNSVDLTDSNWQTRISNIYDTTPEQNTKIAKLQEACVTNEDSALDYLSDIENVTQSGGWTANATTKYALVVTDVTDGDAKVELQTFSTDDSPATKFDELTDFDGDATAASSLNTTGSTTKEGMLAMVKYGTVADTTPAIGSRQLTLTRLTNRNLATTVENTESGDANKIALTKKANLFVASNVDHREGDTAKSFLMGMELHEMFSDETTHGIYNHGGAVESFFSVNTDTTYFLTVEGTAGGSGTKTYFKKFTYLDQLRGVKFYNAQTGSDPVDADTSMVMYPKVFGTGAAPGHGVTFRPSKTNAGLTLGQLKNEQYFLYRETGGMVELMPFPAENIEASIGSGGGGGGNVKWNGGSGANPNANGTVVLGADTPHPVDADSNPLNVSETATDNVKLTYAPTLFGICKDDGSYEYRYFLTSRALTSEELS